MIWGTDSSLRVRVRKWDSKFTRTRYVGVLFNLGADESLLDFRGGAWRVGDVQFPPGVIARRRCANGLDLACCCVANWNLLVWHPEAGELAVEVRCSTSEHETFFIPRSIIQEVILPRDAP